MTAVDNWKGKSNCFLAQKPSFLSHCFSKVKNTQQGPAAVQGLSGALKK